MNKNIDQKNLVTLDSSEKSFPRLETVNNCHF